MGVSTKRLYGVVGGITILCLLGSLLLIRAAGHHGASPGTTTSHVGASPSASGQTPPATPTPRPTLPPAPPVGVTVHGTQFYSHGRPITLIGFNHSTLEYSCAGDGHFAAADYATMKRWGANSVRIPLSSVYWSNAGNSCPSYRATVTTAVANARAAGLFVILDLQWSAPVALPGAPQSGGAQCPMPDAGKDVQVWRDLATLYREDTGVLFDLYGEPEPFIPWSLWFNGGTLVMSGYTACYVNGARIYGNYQAIGMRPLAAIVRAIAPSNVIIIGGRDWGFDLSGVGQGFTVPGSNIVYATHPWDHADKVQADWGWAFGGVVGRYPIIADEFGEYANAGCDPGADFVASAISYFNAHGISWLAWNWAPGRCSLGGTAMLITDWSGTPNGTYGAYVRAQMLARASQNR